MGWISNFHGIAVASTVRSCRSEGFVIIPPCASSWTYYGIVMAAPTRAIIALQFGS